MVVSSLFTAFPFSYVLYILDTDIPICGNAYHILVDSGCILFSVYDFSYFLLRTVLRLVGVYV